MRWPVVVVAPRRALPASLALFAGLLGCAAERAEVARPAPAEASGAALFAEAPPMRGARELFGELRALDVDVELVEGQRLFVRMNDGAHFQRAAELLGDIDHELAVLDLAWLTIDDLWPLVYLDSAERVDLRGLGATDLAPLRQLKHLRALSLAETDFERLGVLAELPRLEALDLSSARVDLGAVGALTGLRELDLTQARTAPRGFELRDGEGLDLMGLRELESLERLVLVNTRVRDWTPLRRLWTLREIDLSYTNFQDLEILAGFGELEDLRLRRTAVSELRPLVGLEGLRRVDLRNCELVDPAELQRLRALRPELIILD